MASAEPRHASGRIPVRVDPRPDPTHAINAPRSSHSCRPRVIVSTARDAVLPPLTPAAPREQAVCGRFVPYTDSFDCRAISVVRKILMVAVDRWLFLCLYRWWPSSRARPTRAGTPQAGAWRNWLEDPHSRISLRGYSRICGFVATIWPSAQSPIGRGPRPRDRRTPAPAKDSGNGVVPRPQNVPSARLRDGSGPGRDPRRQPAADLASRRPTYTGPTLYDVLQAAQPTFRSDVKNDALRYAAVVHASDGYESVVSWARSTPASPAPRCCSPSPRTACRWRARGPG
ncbi:hypothetical protein FraQA3DRAFT_2883 [Frankia sp. QA3]|nr:hypothetical protein FraQA3DRAFT_2883 [Frankia sp. QA3]